MLLLGQLLCSQLRSEVQVEQCEIGGRRIGFVPRLAGEVDAAYTTLEHAFALGLTVNNRNRSDLEFLPFQGDSRFMVLRAKSEAYVAAQRKKIAARLPAELREPVTVEPWVGTAKLSQTGTKPREL